MPLRLPRLAAAVALTLAVPASAAAAPRLAPLKPCYDAVKPSETEPVVVEGAGFTPNALVDIAVDGEATFSGVLVDGKGRLDAGTVPAPFVRSGSRPFDVTVTEQADEAQTVTASSRVTRLTATVTPRAATPARTVRFKGSGFTEDRPVYAHYVLRERVRRTVRLGSPKGACGRLDVRRRQFPFNPRTGRWILQLDQQRRYSAEPETPSLQLRIRVSAR